MGTTAAYPGNHIQQGVAVGREGRLEQPYCSSANRTIPTLIFPQTSGCQHRGVAWRFFFLLRGSQRRKRGKREDTAQPRMQLCWLLPDGFPKPPNRMLLCIISKAQLSMYINEKHCCATNLSGLDLAVFLGWKSHSSHNRSIHPAA